MVMVIIDYSHSSNVTTSLQDIPEEIGIDIQSTDNETESQLSETESDRDFVVPDGTEEDATESEYEPPDCEVYQSSESTDLSHVCVFPITFSELSLIWYQG